MVWFFDSSPSQVTTSTQGRRVCPQEACSNMLCHVTIKQ